MILFPTGLIISNVIISHYTPNFINTSLNLKTTTYGRGVHQIKGSFDVTVSGEQQKRLFESFLLKIQGKLNPFYLNLKGRFNSPTVTTVAVPVSSIAGIGALSLNTSTFMGTISEGDMFSISNDTKVRIATSTTTTNTALTFFPPLTKPLLITDTLNFKNVNLYVRSTTDDPKMNYTQSGIIHTTKIKFEEVL